jgi:hypothetical protein
LRQCTGEDLGTGYIELGDRRFGRSVVVGSVFNTRADVWVQ